MIHRILIAVVAFTIAAYASPASAAPRHETRETTSVAVRIADLDLAKDHDVAVLMRRVGRAADRVCGGRPSSTTFPQERRAFRICRAEAIGPVVSALEERYWTVQWAANATRPLG